MNRDPGNYCMNVTQIINQDQLSFYIEKRIEFPLYNPKRGRKDDQYASEPKLFQRGG